MSRARLSCTPSLFLIVLAGLPFLLLAAVSHAKSGDINEIIPPDRKVNWSPGVMGGIPEVPIVKNAADYGATPGDGADDRLAIQNAINAAAAAGGGAVFLPAGVYDIRSRTQSDGALYLPSGVVLRGEGPDRTFLQFNLSAYPNDDVAGIKVLAWDYGTFTPATGGYGKGSTILTVSDASSFRAGDYAEIEEENDDKISDQGWSLNAVGEMVKILAVSDNKLRLEKPLNYGYEAARHPQIRRVGVISHAGVERLHLKRLDSGGGQMILLFNVANVWVREVESEFILNSHVLGYAAYQCEIRDSYFHEAWGYGSGGQGYGVNLERHATNCLVENNIFRYLRHAIVTQVGASGNVFSYNYSFNRPSSLTDASIHGHWPSYNLFEGNIVQEVNDTDYWGASGPGNTFFRMCIQAEGIQLKNDSDNQNLVGNVLGDEEANIITEDESIQGTLKHGNYEMGEVGWDPAIPDHTLPDSYYLDGKPNFYDYQDMAWPSTGSDINTNQATCMNPARERWNDGSIIPHPFYLRNEKSGDDIVLRWVHRYEYSIYEVWRSTHPNFTPGDVGTTRIVNGMQPPEVGDGARYVDVNVLQDGVNYYYAVRGVDGPNMSAPSNEVGVFVQTLVTGN